MAYFYRMIFVLLFCSNSWALIPTIQKFYTPNGGGTARTPATAVESPQLVFDSWKIEFELANPRILIFDSAVTTGPNPVICVHSFNPATGIHDAQICRTLSIVAAACPANSTPSGAQCACTSPFVEDSTHTSCIDPAVAKCADAALKPPIEFSATKNGSSLGVFTFCAPVPNGGGAACNLTGLVDFCASADGLPPFNCSGTGGKFSATPCILDTLPPSVTGTTPTFNPDPPPKGLCPGTVNGVDVFVPCGSTTGSTTQTQTTTTVPPGGGTPTVTTNSTNTTVICSGGSCNVTTTTGGGGGGSTTTNTTVPQTSFCQQNPGASVCAGDKPGSFRGSCTSGFSCTGDAVQCAIAREQHSRDCQLFAESPESAQYAIEKTSPVRQSQSTVNIGAQPINSSNSLGVAGTCLPPVQLSIMGSSVTVDFVTICSNLAILGNIALAASFLLGGRILARG